MTRQPSFLLAHSLCDSTRNKAKRSSAPSYLSGTRHSLYLPLGPGPTPEEPYTGRSLRVPDPPDTRVQALKVELVPGSERNAQMYDGTVNGSETYE